MSENYFCKNRAFHGDKIKNCSLCNLKGDAKMEVEAIYTCPNNNKVKLKHLGTNTLGGPIVPMTVQQIQADRKARSRRHFQTDIMPNIPRSTAEGKHFRKKYSKKGN